ncbi:MEMO1 family [Dipodascopsis tothii]|uniref:MEMO1 family n=1 Tax=Dipodascopsis tothii TaxID=44089 RepID=UPI0034CD83C8
MLRRATHAGSWYKADPAALDADLTSFLDAVPAFSVEHGALPIRGARIIIAPHAGYDYSGPTGAWAYKAWDVSNIKRVFVLGPSHHVYLRGCAISKCAAYETPLGPLPLDGATLDALEATGRFERMSRETDEDEHSLEMHLPFVRKILAAHYGPDRLPPLVPIMVGALTAAHEREYGQLLAPYLADKANAFVFSTDFCHWGQRFGYTAYVDDPEDFVAPRALGRSSAPVSAAVPIYRSIEALDYRGMDIATDGSHALWTQYLADTGNTICGRHPLGVLLAAVELRRAAGQELPDADRQPAEGTTPQAIVREQGLTGEDALKYQFGKIYWVQYKQSSRSVRLADSSVSYASGFAKA